MAFRRRAPEPPPDPFAGAVDVASLPPTYRATVEDALRARAQFQSLVGATAPGPLQDRLGELRDGVDAGVLAVWQAAQQAVRLESVVAALDPDRVTADLKRAKRAASEDTADVEAEATRDALTARFASLQRLLNALEEMRRRIPVLEARLGTAVARAAELTLTSSVSSSAAELDVLRAELDQLVDELGALQSAVAAAG